jgi:sarcosine oxidase
VTRGRASALDVVVIGLGVMGSAIARETARRGMRVLALDRYAPPHAFGSSHGETRIIREAYFEHPSYVPLVQRAYDLWRELEAASDAKLLLETGGLMIGRPDSELVAGARRSAEQHGLRYEMLAAAEVRNRFPALHPEPEMVAVWEPHAGILDPEACIAALLAQARSHGAELRFDEPVEAWRIDGEGVCVQTARGEYRASQLVVAAGAWTGSLLPELQSQLRVERQVLYWFGADRNTSQFAAQHCPVHLWQYDGRRFFYGFPDLGNGVKVAFHHGGAPVTAETVEREVAPAEVEAMRRALQRFMPDADGPLRRALACLYTNTRDEHFLIDRHPACPQVVVASPCSGHGFKFGPTIGEVVADLLEGRAPRLDAELFRWRTA